MWLCVIDRCVYIVMCSSIVCPEEESASLSLWTIMSKVRLEAFMWVSTGLIHSPSLSLADLGGTDHCCTLAVDILSYTRASFKSKHDHLVYNTELLYHDKHSLDCICQLAIAIRPSPVTLSGCEVSDVYEGCVFRGQGRPLENCLLTSWRVPHGSLVRWMRRNRK